MKTVLVVLALLCSSAGRAELTIDIDGAVQTHEERSFIKTPFADWSATDRSLYAFYTACHAYDFIQSEWAFENGYHEMNEALSSKPSDASLVTMKLTALLGMYLIAEYAPEKWRGPSILLMDFWCVVGVGLNHEKGVHPW